MIVHVQRVSGSRSGFHVPDYLAAWWRNTLNGTCEGVIRFVGLVVWRVYGNGEGTPRLVGVGALRSERKQAAWNRS